MFSSKARTAGASVDRTEERVTHLGIRPPQAPEVVAPLLELLGVVKQPRLDLVLNEQGMELAGRAELVKFRFQQHVHGQIERHRKAFRLVDPMPVPQPEAPRTLREQIKL